LIQNRFSTTWYNTFVLRKEDEKGDSMKKVQYKRINKLFYVRLLTTGVWMVLVYLELTRHSLIQTTLLVGTIILGPIYCGWFCPMGFIQNLFGKIGRVFNLPKLEFSSKIHYYARFIKYGFWFFALLPFGFEVFNLLGIEPRRTMNMLIIGEIIPSISIIGLVVFAFISLFNERFYCKYLCTKGAEYNLLSSFRIMRIKRTSTCVSCNKCNNDCPMQVDLMKKKVVNDITCISCLDCVDTCKVKGSIHLGITPLLKKIKLG
jgi:polyferredoxin